MGGINLRAIRLVLVLNCRQELLKQSEPLSMCKNYKAEPRPPRASQGKPKCTLTDQTNLTFEVAFWSAFRPNLSCVSNVRSQKAGIQQWTGTQKPWSGLATSSSQHRARPGPKPATSGSRRRARPTAAEVPRHSSPTESQH